MTSCGYFKVFTDAATVYAPAGAVPAIGDLVVASGPGSCSTAITAAATVTLSTPPPTPTPTASPTPVPTLPPTPAPTATPTVTTGACSPDMNLKQVTTITALLCTTVASTTTVTSYSQPALVQLATAKVTSATSVSVTLPSAPYAGFSDVLLCVAKETAGSGATIAAPGGLTALTPSGSGSAQVNAGTALGILAAYRVVQSGDTAGPYTFTTSGSTPPALSASCKEYAYVNTLAPMLASAFVSQTTGATPVSISITPTAPTLLVTDVAAISAGGAGSSGSGSSTEYDDINGTLYTHGQRYVDLSVSGSRTESVSYPSTPSADVGITIALAPISSGAVASVPTVTPTPGATPTPGVAPAHVKTAVYGWGYNGISTSVSIAQQALHVTWAYQQSSFSQQYQLGGIHTIAYTNHWLCYPTDNPLTCYNELKPGGTYADAEAKNCGGTPVTDPHYGTGYLNDPRVAHSVNVAEDRIGTVSPYIEAFFSDDTASTGGLTNDPPCGYTFSSWLSALNALHTAVAANKSTQFFVNALNAWTLGASPVDLAGTTTPSAVLGAMCESCFVTNVGAETGATWVSHENAAIAVVNNAKIFWDYCRNTASASTSQALRIYCYASFLLTYDPSYSMVQTAFATPFAFPVMPESHLVPMSPLATSITTISAYAIAGGGYERQWANCYYNGTSLGFGCAVVINPGTGSLTVPAGYAHSLVLTGGGVCDTYVSSTCSGGTASFTGGPVTTLAAGTAAILFP